MRITCCIKILPGSPPLGNWLGALRKISLVTAQQDQARRWSWRFVAKFDVLRTLEALKQRTGRRPMTSLLNDVREFMRQQTLSHSCAGRVLMRSEDDILTNGVCPRPQRASGLRGPGVIMYQYLAQVMTKEEVYGQAGGAFQWTSKPWVDRATIRGPRARAMGPVTFPPPRPRGR